MILHVDPYDASDSIEEAPKASHMTFKDIRVLAVVFVVLFLLMIPIYLQLMEQRNEHVCRTNLEQIGKALNLYATSNDDRFPPIYVQGDNREPLLDAYGAPYTWGSQARELMNIRTSLKCDSAHDEEHVYTEDPSQSSRAKAAQSGRVGMPMSYGMYTRLSAIPINLIPNPNTTILVAETSNFGANGSYNPVPFRNADGKIVPVDGFLIGYSNDNFDYGPDTRAVTRLAFSGTSQGKFGPDTGSRHNQGINGISAAGSLVRLKPENAAVRMLGGDPQGHWASPPPVR